jgi:hypothetical protein
MTRERLLVVGRRRRPHAPLTPPRLALAPAPGDEPRVRWARVTTARTRIGTGYYERPDVQDLVVTAVLNELRRR